MTRSEGQSSAKSSLVITIKLLDHKLGSLLEISENFLIDILELLEDILGLGFHHILLTWDWDSTHFDASHLLNSIQELLVLVVEESDANP